MTQDSWILVGRLAERVEGFERRLSRIENIFELAKIYGLRALLILLLVCLAIIVNMPAGKVMERAAGIFNDALN